MLDYNETSIYVEPFGGGARTLLNKPRHDCEIYNDGSAGLCAFMRVMSDRDKASALIARLYETEYSWEQFDEARVYCRQVDDMWKLDREDCKQWKNILVSLIGKFDDQYAKDIEQAQAKIIKLNTDEAYEAWNQFMLLKSRANGESDDQTPPPVFDELQMATDVFVTYTQSRDGMGTHFSSGKFKTQAAYLRRVDRLYEVAERMQGVQIWNVDAELFFIERADLFARPDVMAYLDPPYLDEENKNLGTVYRQQMESPRHELFLKLAVEAKCKILVSNYDNELYRDYLHDWTRIDVPVKTSVGGKKDNKRVEVLWYNY